MMMMDQIVKITALGLGRLEPENPLRFGIQVKDDALHIHNKMESDACSAIDSVNAR